MRRAALLVLTGSLVAGCGAHDFRCPQAPATEGPPAAAALHALFAAEWEETLREDPVYASRLGDHRFDDRWPDVSRAARDHDDAHAREVLARVRAFDPSPLSADDRLSYELFRRKYELLVEGQPFHLDRLAIDQNGGVQNADDVAAALPFATVHDYEAWIARLRSLPTYLEQTTTLLREGMAERIVHPRVVMERVGAQIAKQVVATPEESPFFQPLKRVPASVSAADRDRLVREARAAVADGIVPAYRRFQDFFVREYVPACFPQVGAWQLPHGDDAYAYLVRRETTTNLRPQEAHDLGLREVARVRGEMLAQMEALGFKGTLPQLFAWLRTDPRFFFSDPKALFEAYEATAKRIDPKLVSLFRTLPRTPYGVAPVPAAIAPDTTTAYYREPAADGSRAGTFFVNLYAPASRPRWEMMALALHESVPGHHLQIAIASERKGLPDFRRHASWTAFTEGWGLYAESLGDEMGLYDDPYSKLGQLTYEMWRAVRLVVDTGMHAMHWDRQRAIDYFLDNAPKTLLDVTNEIDRYIVWPGQALAYKVGQLEILRLRRQARAALGDRFDVREFHDVVLRDGALPLDVLDRQVTAWIESKRAGSTPAATFDQN
jgi:prolyl oligopeptidase